MTPIIEDEDRFANTLLTNCVAALIVWDNILKCDVSYYFRKTFGKPSKVEELKKYRGSSQGKNRANPKILKEIDKSPNPPRIRVLEHNVLHHDLGFHEQKAVMLHNFPIGGHDKKSKDCFNEKYPTDGISEDNMRSHIAADLLREKIKKHQDPNDAFKFPTGFSTKEEIKYLKKNNLFVQARWEKEGSNEAVEYYKIKMEEKPYPNEWLGKFWLLMPREDSNQPIGTGSNHHPRILDGNQSGAACIRVPDMPGLNDIRIPYEDHYLINETDLETIGNEFNAEPEIKSDYVDEPDILRNLRNTLVRNKLFTKKGNPQLDHYLVNKLFKPLHKTNREIRWYKNQIKKEYKEEKETKERLQLGYYDFRETALKDNDGDNNNKRKFDELVKPIDLDKFCKIHQTTYGLEEKIGKNIDFKTQPKKLLSFITFKMEDDYLKSKKNKDYWRFESHKLATTCEVTIALLNPTGKEYTLFEKSSIPS